MIVREVMALAAATKRGRSKGSELSYEGGLESLEAGLSRVLNTQIWHLSGGEYQFIALAGARIKCEGGLDIATNMGNRQIVLAMGRVVAELSGNQRITELSRLHSLLESFID